MANVDEGLVHAWVEGQLPPEEAERVAQLVETDAAWSAAAAEARGLIAASARVLSALDTGMPSVRSETARTGKTHASTVPARGRTRPVVRLPWLGIAAAAVLVAGVGVLGIRGFDNGVRVLPVESAAPPPSVTSTAATPAQSPASGVTAPNAPVPPAVHTEQATRDAREKASSASAAAPPAALSARGPVQTGDRTGGRAVSDAVGAGHASNVAGMAAAADEMRAQRNEVQVSTAMKAIAPNLPDSVTRGCWRPIDAAQGQLRQAAESSAPVIPVLRFTAPIVTDLGGTRAPTSQFAGGGRGGRTGAMNRPIALPVQNATLHRQDDSTFAAEWLHPDGKTTKLSFRIAGDTLRGTTNEIERDMVTVGPPLVAVRGPCGR